MEQYAAGEQLSAHALSAYGFSPEDIERIQAALFSLLARRTARYTMGDSSSVPAEIAEELFRSICFSIELYLRRTGNVAALLSDDYDALLQQAWETLESDIVRGKLLLKQALITAPDLSSRAYADTLRGIGVFFQQYDYRFFAHAIPGSIDYPLCHPVSEEMLGIAYINAYLERLNIENDLFGRFCTATADRLLKCISADYSELWVNLYEPVAVNAIGRALLGLDVLPLDITDQDRLQLAALLSDTSSAALEAQLTSAVQRMTRQLAITKEANRSYLLQTALSLAPRIRAVKGKFSYLFPSLF